MKLIQISSNPVRFIRPDRVTEVSEEPSCTAVRFLDGTAMYLNDGVYDLAEKINDALAEPSHGPQEDRPGPQTPRPLDRR